MKIDSLKINDFQKAAGLTGNQLAELIGLTPTGLSRIKRLETTRPTTARCLARALGVKLEDIQKKEEE